jgi:[FeFe] hydrogenase H-cluster maturation GTPase HydF
MDSAPRAIRPHVAIFGRRNVGKSSLINALTGQSIALVSDIPGTTTDPVFKNIELLPFGPVVLIDTPGLDDSGELGKMRVEATQQVLRKTDSALVVLEPKPGLDDSEEKLFHDLSERKIPIVAVVNKCDDGIPAPAALTSLLGTRGIALVAVSARTGHGIPALREDHLQKSLKDFDLGTILGDLIAPGEIIILVTPIDLAAPKGRLILPQVQTIRDILDSDAVAMVTKERELRATLEGLKKPPALVVTDSQAFLKVAADVPPGVPFTSFSVLFARYKGDLPAYVDGIRALKNLPGKARVLIAESCTHHQVADDIGRVKIPRWFRRQYGGDVEFTFTQGGDFPDDLAEYHLVVQCGGCMANRRAILDRIAVCREKRVPITNYGILIAHLHGVLEDALKPLGLSAAP